MIKAVLFDFHNTLAICDGWLDLEINLLPALSLQVLARRGLLPESASPRHSEAVDRFKAVRQQVRASGIEVSAAEGTRRVLEEMGYEVTMVAIEAAVALLEEELLPQVEMVDGAEVALRGLREEGYRLGIVSSAGYPPFVEMALEKMGLLHFFKVVVTSAGEGVYKSDPEIFRRAVRYLDVEPEEAVHVGDHPVYDVQTAKAAGLSAIWFSAHAERTAHLHSTPWADARLAGEGADAVISDLRDAARAVQQISARP